MFDQRLERLSKADARTAAILRTWLNAADGDRPDTGRRSRLSPDFLAQFGGSRETADERILILLGAPEAVDLANLLAILPEPVRLFLLERNATRALNLFRQFPIESYIEKGRLIAAIGDDEEEVEGRFFQMLNVQRSPEFEFLDPQTSTPADMGLYIELLTRICKAVRLDLFNAGTLVSRGPLWQHNTIVNLPHLIANPGVSRLRNILCGKPALIVAAGPSLNDSLHSLAKVRDSFVVISTGTALRALRAAGIRPDLVAAVDASHLTAPQFETPCDDLYLACSSLVFPPILPKFRGLFSGTLDASPIDRWIDSLTTPRGSLFAGGTVTSSAIDLAVIMGCDPVVTIGLDLCFADDGTTHADNTMYHGRRLDPKNLLRVPGNLQEQVYTSNQFHCYIHFLEEYIEHHPRTQFVNANHGGARIQGMKVTSPSGLGCLAGERFDATAVIQRVHASYSCPDRAPQQAREELERVRAQLDRILADVQRGAMLCNQLIMILRSPRAGDDAVAREHMSELDAIDRRVAEAQESSVFLKMSLWPATYQAGTRPAHHEQRYAGNLLAGKRCRELYEQIGGAARWTRDALQGVIQGLSCATPDRTASTRRANRGHPCYETQIV